MSTNLSTFVSKPVGICRQTCLHLPTTAGMGMRTPCFARLRGAESILSRVPNPRAALRLPGVRERPPLRGCCGAQSLATFERGWVMRTACFARLRGAESILPSVPNPGLRYACPGLERGRLFEAVAAHSPWRPLRGGGLCALRASRVFEALSPYCPASLTPGCATLARG